jgi:hypothetical protein
MPAPSISTLQMLTIHPEKILETNQVHRRDSTGNRPTRLIIAELAEPLKMLIVSLRNIWKSKKAIRSIRKRSTMSQVGSSGSKTCSLNSPALPVKVASILLPSAQTEEQNPPSTETKNQVTTMRVGTLGPRKRETVPILKKSYS